MTVFTPFSLHTSSKHNVTNADAEHSLLRLLYDALHLVWGSDDKACDLPSELLGSGQCRERAGVDDAFAVLEENQGMRARGSCIPPAQ